MRINSVLLLAVLHASVVPVAAQETASQVAALSVSEQTKVVHAFVERVMAILASPIAEGASKTPERLQKDRLYLNLMRALFAPAKGETGEPEGYAIVYPRIRRFATENPTKPLFEIVGEFVEGRRKKYLTDEVMAWLPARADTYQEAWFRYGFKKELFDAQQNGLERASAEAEATARAKLKGIWDRAVVLSDGRHVLSDGRGNFRVIYPDGKGPHVVLAGAAAAEAERKLVCIENGGAIAVCNASR